MFCGALLLSQERNICDQQYFLEFKTVLFFRNPSIDWTDIFWYINNKESAMFCLSENGF